MTRSTLARTAVDELKLKATSELARSSTRKCACRRRVRWAANNDKLVTAGAMLMEHGARPNRAYKFAICLANARAHASLSTTSNPKRQATR